MEILSRHEELVLLAAWRLQDGAYGAAIRNHLAEVTGEDLSIASVYAPLDRLAARGYLETYQGPPTPERGGRGKRLYRVTAEGAAALDRVRQIQAALSAGLPRLAFE